MSKKEPFKTQQTKEENTMNVSVEGEIDLKLLSLT